MNILFFKLTIIPLVIGFITFISRKWGNRVGGVVGSMPWVAGPILVFFILEQGKEFGISSIPGILMGIISLVSFCYCYALLSKQMKWLPTLLISYIAFGFTAIALDTIHLSLWGIYVLALVVIVVALYYFPKPSVEQVTPAKGKPPTYDILFRMLVATLFVLSITGLAAILGPNWSGVLTPFPILTSILAIFNHYLQGSKAAIIVLRGIMIGLVGFTTFLFLQAFLLHEFSVAVSFLIALVVNSAINLVSSRVWR
jgi:hypothetical protein